MAWTNLPTDYTDATWSGNRKYTMIQNDDGTVSFEDVTAYSNRENSFFGAKDANQMNGAINEIMATLYDNAGAHNSVYRGKNLGAGPTPEQYAAIADGTFKDLYIGDYWVINALVYRIACFDYFLNSGDTACTQHHVLIVPDQVLYTHVMNDSNTTTGGYVGSKMYTEGLNSAKAAIKADFAGHVLKHREYFVNAVTDGHPVGGAWLDSEVDLMNENMVYGMNIFLPRANGSGVYANHTIDKGQLPLFALRHDLIIALNRKTWWLRDAASGSVFALAGGDGSASTYNASYAHGVRPAFCIF